MCKTAVHTSVSISGVHYGISVRYATASLDHCNVSNVADVVVMFFDTTSELDGCNLSEDTYTMRTG